MTEFRGNMFEYAHGTVYNFRTDAVTAQKSKMKLH